MLTLVLAAMLGAASTASASHVPVGDLDARCEGTYNNVTYGDGQPLAQTFVARSSGKLTNVYVGGYTVDGSVQIAAADHGYPTETVLASTPAPYDSTGAGTEVNFSYNEAASVVEGKQYALVLRGSYHGWSTSTGNRCNDGGFFELRPTTGWAYFERSDLDAVYYTYVTPTDTIGPTGTVVINDSAARTRTRAVSLTLDATDPPPESSSSSGSGLESMRIKNAGASWTAWQPYAASKNWKLTRGAGKKTVYAQYRDAAGNLSAKASDSITYRP